MLGLKVFTFFFVGYAFAFPESSRIFGGQSATPGQFPYQVSIETDGQHFCGGSIIAETIVVTAAHCTSLMDQSKLTVRAGSVDKGNGGQVSRVKNIVNHPKWDNQKVHNDISIIQLETPIRIDNKSTKIIKLAGDTTKLSVGLQAIVSGWGLTVVGGTDAADIMQFVVVPIMDDAVCLDLYKNFLDNMFCAGWPDSAVGPLRMDSGGPLVAKGKLIGIVSFGRDGFANVYTKVSSFRSWIEYTIRELS